MKYPVESRRTRTSDRQTREVRSEQQVREGNPIDGPLGKRSESQRPLYNTLRHPPIYPSAPDPSTRAEIYQATLRGDGIHSGQAHRDEQSHPRIRHNNQQLPLSTPTFNQCSGSTFPNTLFSQFKEATPDPNLIIRRPRLPSIQTQYSSSNYSESTTSSHESGCEYGDGRIAADLFAEYFQSDLQRHPREIDAIAPEEDFPCCLEYYGIYVGDVEPRARVRYSE